MAGRTAVVTVGATSIAILAATLTTAGAAHAAAGPPLSAAPSRAMPYITTASSTVTQIVQCGSTMYAVGNFTQVGLPSGARYPRRGAFSFNATTGAVSGWNPNVNGMVNSISLTSNCATAYLSGTFTAVHGTAVKNLVKVSASTGAVDTAFRPRPSGPVLTTLLHGSTLLAGGRFITIGGVTRRSLASLNPATGSATSYSTLVLAGTIPGNSGGIRIHKMRVSPNGSRVIMMGNFTSINGAQRLQMFVADLGAKSLTLDKWYSPTLNLPCASNVEPFFVRSATWSPDGGRIYIGATGYKGTSPLCDAAAAFSSVAIPTQTALWINKTGCDSLYAVAADATSVYIGGHERWANNEKSCDSAGRTAVSRPGMAGLSATTGRALAWNPTRSRGRGADDMLRTSAGLWVASDTYFNSNFCAKAYHPGICFLPNA